MMDYRKNLVGQPPPPDMPESQRASELERHNRELGGRLLAFRRLAGLSQEELAEHSGLSVRAVRNLERGRTRWPRPDSVRRLADALQLRGIERGEFIAAAGRRAPQIRTTAQEAGHADSLPPMPPVVPRQLPVAVRNFVGRAGELEWLSALADEAAGARPTLVVTVIGGMAGVGKTALAVHFGHQAAEFFPDGQLYVNLCGFDPPDEPVSPGEAIAGFLDALGVHPERIPADPHARAGLYRSLLAGKRMLIVLDNACDAAQVRMLLPGSAGCLVVVTSRNEMAGLAAADGAQLLTLDVLTENDAVGLLAARLGPRRVAAEPKAVAELSRLCSRLPLALAIAAGRAAARPAHPLGALAAELREVTGRLDALDAGEPAASVRAVFSWSSRHLSGAGARMFRLLSVHPGPDISAAAAASLAGASLPQARSALRELTAASLLAEHSPGRYMLHDLLRCYATELACCADSEGDRRAAIRRVLDHYLHTANGLLAGRWRALELPAPEHLVIAEVVARDDAMAWFEAEREILLRLAGQAAANGFDARAWQLPWTMTEFLDWRGYWHDWAAAQDIALAAARRLGDQAGQARACHSVGQACIRLTRYDDGDVYLKQALDLYVRAGDTNGQVHVHSCRCNAFVWQHRYGEALTSALRTLDVLGPAGPLDLRAMALNNAGYCYALVGDPWRALTWCEQAQDLFRQLGSRFGQADTWDSIAYARQCLGHHGKAIDCYRRALSLHLGNRYKYARTAARLGDAYRETGNAVAARDAWQQALAIFDGLHHVDADLVRAKLRDLRLTARGTGPAIPATGTSHHAMFRSDCRSLCLACAPVPHPH